MEGIGTQQVSDHLGRSQATVQSWINRFRSNGIEGLLSKGKGNGPASRLTPEMEQAMRTRLGSGQGGSKRPAPATHKKTQRLKQPSAVTLADQITRLTIPAGLPVRLWVYD